MKNTSIKKEVTLNLFQDFRRLLLPLLNTLRGRFQAPVLRHYGAGPKVMPRFGMTHLYHYGFTLVELLVVVLIIAVLAMVAMPMYKHAVLKSRFSTVMPMAKTIAEAQEVYFLGNNQYALSEEYLDVEPVAAEGTSVALAPEEQEDHYNYVAAYTSQVPGARYIMYQKHSPKFASTIQCEADAEDKDALWLCEKGLGGTEIPGGGVNTTQGKSYKTFLLEGNTGGTSFIPPCPEGATCSSDTGAVTGCNTGYYVSEGSCAACPANSTCNSNTGAIISCTPGYYESSGTCVTQTTRDSKCTGGEDGSCQNINYTRTGSGQQQMCLSSGSYGCKDSTFSGTGTQCQGLHDYACSNTVYTGFDSSCSGNGFRACYNSTFYGQSYCNPGNNEVCEGATYLRDEQGVLACCYDGTGRCPVGVPVCQWNTSTSNKAKWMGDWKGGCCNPTAVGGEENCGTTPLCS